MKPYSFLDENYDIDNDNYDDDFQIRKRKIRRNWHTPQSRHNARLGTVGSYSSITQKPFNNIYGDR